MTVTQTRADLAQAVTWRPAPTPLAVLRGCGWLSAADAAHPRLRLDAAASSHTVFRVTAPDGRCVVVKQVPRSAAERGRGLGHELFMYRLAAWMPEIADLLPQPVHLDENRQLLVVQSLALGTTWPDPQALLPLRRAGVATALGHALATLHRATADMGLGPSPAVGVLGLGAGLAPACEGRRPEVVSLMQAIVASPVLHGALAEGLATYRHRCIIHGDLRPENWLPAPPPASGLRLLDWEIAGSGDPAWDLASLLAQAVSEAVLENGPASATPVTPWPATAWAACSDALRAYFSTEGLLAADDVCETGAKLVRYTVARLLHLATECAEQGVAAEAWPVHVLIEAATTLAQASEAAANALLAERVA